TPGSPDPLANQSRGRSRGTVYHCYSSYARGTEFLMGYYAILDRAPQGRGEGDQRVPARPDAAAGICRGRGAPGYAGDLPGVVRDKGRGGAIVMPAHRRQPFGGLVAVTGLGLLAGLLAAGCTSPSPARQQPAAHPRAGAAARIAALAAPGGVDVRAENARPGY